MREEEMSLVPQSGAEKGTFFARFLTLKERRKKSLFVRSDRKE
jgi:hypothetical protein